MPFLPRSSAAGLERRRLDSRAVALAGGYTGAVIILRKESGESADPSGSRPQEKRPISGHAYGRRSIDVPGGGAAPGLDRSRCPLGRAGTILDGKSPAEANPRRPDPLGLHLTGEIPDSQGQEPGLGKKPRRRLPVGRVGTTGDRSLGRSGPDHARPAAQSGPPWIAPYHRTAGRVPGRYRPRQLRPTGRPAIGFAPLW